MLAQSTDAQALLKSCIADFNSRLASRMTQFGKNNTGVSYPPTSLVMTRYLIQTMNKGRDLVVGL